MAYTGGVYAAPSNSWNPAVAGSAINATDWAALLADLTTALSTCVLKDGTQTITANLPMGGFKLTGLGVGSAAGNSVRWEQSAVGVVTTAGDIIQATGSGAIARLGIGTAGQFPAVNAGATALAYQSMATQSDQETSTSILAPVTPGRQQFHPSAAKAWVQATTGGVATVSYNVSSVTDVGTGKVGISFSTSFSSANYARLLSVDTNQSFCPGIDTGGTQTGARADFVNFNSSSVAADPAGNWYISFFGDQ